MLSGSPESGAVTWASQKPISAPHFPRRPRDNSFQLFVLNTGASDRQVDKGKLFPKAQQHFVTRGGVCFYKDKPFAVNGANCTAPVPDGAAIN